MRRANLFKHGTRDAPDKEVHVKRKKLAILSLLALTVFLFPLNPASAIGVGVFANGSITPDSALGACASVTFPVNTTAVGEFSAVGEVQGPGTKVGTIRGAIPIVINRGTSWSGCIAGAYSGATAGEAKYTLTASGANGGEIIYVVQCTVTNGTVSCI